MYLEQKMILPLMKLEKKKMNSERNRPYALREFVSDKSVKRSVPNPFIHTSRREKYPAKILD